MITTTVINPFSVSLGKQPFMKLDYCVYENGDYRIFKHTLNHYVHTFKNIVISERGAANKQLITNLIAGNIPKDEASLYHDFERPKQAILDGMEAAKKLNFIIN